MRATVYHAGVHLREDELLSVERCCPMCLATEARKPVLRVQTNPDVHMLSCPRCGGFSASRLPTPETLRRYYAQYYPPGGPTVTFGDPVRFARHVIGEAWQFLNQEDVSILDFGGGGGELSRAVAALLVGRGTPRVGIDIVDYNRALRHPRAERIAVRQHETLTEVAGQRFDLVLASAVLEHVPYPRQALIDLLSAVRPGGVLYARTPSLVPLFRIMQFFHLRYDFTYPAHLHDFGQAFWERILPCLGCDPASYSIVRSRPSITETEFRRNPARTAVAYALKSPWYLFSRHYRLVGGWEILIRREPKAAASGDKIPRAPCSRPATAYDPDLFAGLADVEDRHFWFAARNRVIASITAQVTGGLPPRYRVLEAGCGIGTILRVLEKACRDGVVIGMDLFAEGLMLARRRSSCLVVQGDVRALPFRPAFHVVGLFDVLEHVPDDDAVLRGLRELLMPGGVLLLSTPAHRCLWSHFDEAAHHYRRYEPAELRHKLTSAGYDVEYLTHCLASLFPLTWVWRRLASLIAGRTGDAGRARGLALRELRVLPILNNCLRFLLDQELRFIVARRRLPIGTSLIAVCRKPQ